jgi:hypothetical protein
MVYESIAKSGSDFYDWANSVYSLVIATAVFLSITMQDNNGYEFIF